MVGHRCASYAEFQVTGLTRVKISQGYLHDIAIVFIFMLLFVQEHYYLPCFRSYHLQAGACFYCGLDGEGCASMGYLAKPHPAWSTAPVRKQGWYCWIFLFFVAGLDPSKLIWIYIVWEMFECSNMRQICYAEGADVSGDGRCGPLLQAPLPPSTTPCQAKAGGGLGSGVYQYSPRPVTNWLWWFTLYLFCFNFQMAGPVHFFPSGLPQSKSLWWQGKVDWIQPHTRVSQIILHGHLFDSLDDSLEYFDTGYTTESIFNQCAIWAPLFFGLLLSI